MKSPTQVLPIPVKMTLASTPESSPQYAVDVMLKNGEKISVADPTATRAMVALMDMQAVLGGAASHYGGPSAFAELMSATFGLIFHESKKTKTPWYDLFHVINDAGHCENGLYALKANYGFADLNLNSLKGFRSIQSSLTGHGESHLFPEGVYLSNGPLGSSLPQAQGLAFADALAGRSRVTITAISDGGCMEGEAREALAAIPGLAAKGKMAPFVLVISDNNTKLSGRIDEQSFSMQPTFASLKDLGWKLISLENGHDLQKCTAALEEAVAWARQHPDKPVALWAKTIKGFGTEKTEKSSSGGHGFPLKDGSEIRAFITEIYKDREIPGEFLAWAQELENWKKEKKPVTTKVGAGLTSEKVQTGIAKAMIAKKKLGYPIVSVTSDLPGSTGVAEFHKAFPESSVDIGVAEANMVSTAAGLSKEGFIPVVDTFAQFGVTKGALPLIMAALSEAPVIAVFSHVGFQDAADGASHQALSYFAMTAAIPHTDVHCLTSSYEAEALFGQALDDFYQSRKQGKIPRSQIFFLGRENFPQRYLPESYIYRMGQAQVVFDNSVQFKTSITIVAAGALLEQALIAAEKLENDKVGTVVVNPSIINHPDVKTIGEALSRTQGRLMTVEDHQVIGGMGALLAHALNRAGHQFDLISLGVEDHFGQSAYTALELYQKHGLDSDAIVKRVKQSALD